MSERDEREPDEPDELAVPDEPSVDTDYLWDGRGDPPDQLRQLETLAAEHRLRAPLAVRPRRPWRLALVVGGLAAIGAAVLAPRDLIPPRWVAALLPGVSSEPDVLGGSTVEIGLRGEEQPDPAWRRILAERLAASGAALIEDGARLVVETPGVEPDRAVSWVEVATRRFQLELTTVVDGSPLMQALCERVGVDPRAAELGVVADVDSWVHDPSGRRFTDCYLNADDRGALQIYLRDVARADPSLQPEPGFAIVEELLQRPTGGWSTGAEAPTLPRRRGGTARSAQSWRTYYVRTPPEIDRRHFADAAMYWNQMNGRPEVLVTLTDEGARRFADLTERIAGHKLALLLDETVSSAPVVMERIAGGRTSVVMGGGSSEEVEREAASLVAAIKSTPLPFAVDVLSVRGHRPGLAVIPLQVARGLIALLVGLCVAVPLLLLERRSRSIDPEVSPVRGRPRRRAVSRRRLAVTLGGLVLAGLSTIVPMPGFADLAEALHHQADDSLGPFALGISSILSAFGIVELAALLVPRWRGLRHGGPDGRGRLAVATALLAVVFTLAQAFFLTHWLSGFGHEGGGTFGAFGFPEVIDGAAAFWRVFGLYVAGAVGLTLLALTVDRHGLVNGFGCVSLGAFAFTSARAVLQGLHADRAAAGSPVSPALLGGRLGMMVGLSLVVILTAAVLRWRSRSSGARSAFRLPTAGLVPNGAAMAITGGLGLLALWPGAHAERLLGWWMALWTRPIGAAVLLVAVGAGLSWLFSRPSRLGVVATSIDAEAARRVWRGFAWAVLLSLAYVGSLYAIERALGRWSPLYPIPVLMTAFATAITMDLVAEWRAFRRRDDLVPIWPLHQVQRVAGIVDALTRNGIDVHTRSLYWRSTLHFFGPHVPIVLMVPAARRDEAIAIVRAQVGLAPPEPAASVPDQSSSRA